MHMLVRTLGTKQGLCIEIPSFILSLAIAEIFYKFHSFTLECLAFTATWVAISALATWATGVLPRKAGTS